MTDGKGDSRGNLGCLAAILVGLTALFGSVYLTGPLKGFRLPTPREFSLIWLTVLLPVSVWLWLTATRKNFPSKTVFWIGFPLVLAVYVLMSILLN